MDHFHSTCAGADKRRVCSVELFFSVNKQLADKERVAAALENSQLLEVVNQCLSTRSP